MRLLKEFSTRELIDALSYDFDPLQGVAQPPTGTVTPGGNRLYNTPRSARISTLEVAIRAQAKKLLAHPLVVQQLEAIWAGTIVFHSSADNLHRQSGLELRDLSRRSSGRRTPQRPQPTKPVSGDQTPVFPVIRRTVTLYDPHDASLFKLSRLRVPRYRQLFSTISFAIMLGLFVAVLDQKSDDITVLEVVFWFWSAGYMLVSCSFHISSHMLTLLQDEIVGFSEQGFGLYIMSVWNAFDLGILLIFVVYYILRLYGILVPKTRDTNSTSMAYDVLASSAVLLFPRLFSVLDHYRYFSQLLIAFRMMAMDLVAILLLIVITCSGFFVAFTLAFINDFTAPSAAYTLFQMVMGFTPAAWDIWADYNWLGKALLTLFLFICHFLIVTILITVLTNSFMAIVQNANEEHQFLFAVNTISMVKSDALFSYIAPTNILGWLVIPIKFFMPFPKFIKLNRMLIKITHIPILFSIFLYERLLLSNLAYGPTDLVEQRGRQQANAGAFSIRSPTDVFSPGARLREPSITTFQKDRALEEVFRRPFRDPTINATSEIPSGRRKSSNVVRDWMKGMGADGNASPPLEEAPSVLERLEARRPRFRRTLTSQNVYQRRPHPLERTRSVASDPDNTFSFGKPLPIAEETDLDMSMEDLHHHTDADGDDEFVTNDEDEQATSEQHGRKMGPGSDKENLLRDEDDSSEDYFRTPMTVTARTPVFWDSHTSAAFQRQQSQTAAQRPETGSRPGHRRNTSTNTVVFSPTKDNNAQSSRSTSPSRPSRMRSGTATPGRIGDGRRTPKRAVPHSSSNSRARAIMPPRGFGQPARPLSHVLDHAQSRRDPSFNAIALDLASDLGDNRHGPDFGALGALPASFTTQLDMINRAKAQSEGNDETSRISRLMLARMTTLEEGFRDVLREVKELRRGSEDGRQSREGKRGKGRKRGDKRGPRDENMGSSV